MTALPCASTTVSSTTGSSTTVPSTPYPSTVYLSAPDMVRLVQRKGLSA